MHRTRIARKSGARQTTFLAHLGSVSFQKPVCGEVSSHEPRRKNDPAYAREKENRRRQCAENLLHAPWFFHLERNTPKCRRANSGVLIMEPAEKYVSEGDGM